MSLAGKWTRIEDVGILLSMGIFQPAMLGNPRGYIFGRFFWTVAQVMKKKNHALTSPPGRGSMVLVKLARDLTRPKTPKGS